MTCELAHHQDLATKYVARQLSDSEMDEFEQHYFVCAECLAAVQLAEAIAESQDPAVPVVVESSKPAVTQPGKLVEMPLKRPAPKTAVAARYYWMTAAAAAAIALIGFFLWKGQSGAPDSRPVMAKQGQPAPQALPPPSGTTGQDTTKPAASEPALLATAANPVPDLGAIEPLHYRPSVLRGALEDPSERFRTAMQFYQTGDYRQAISLLSAIPLGVAGSGKPEDHITDSGARLFLGISQLMLNENGEAVRTLRQSVAYGDTPYLEPARFYLAKALIRQRQFALAKAELRETAKLGGDLKGAAEGLLAQLDAAPAAPAK